MVFIKDFAVFTEEINANNSRNYKLEILNKYKDNESVRYFLDFIYNPYIVTGISSNKLNKDVGFQSGSLWLDYPEDKVICEYLKEHNTGRDVDIWTVQQYKKMHVNENWQDLFDKIITKSLTLGIDVLSINKCMDNYIPKFNVQLANKYFDKPEIVEGRQFALTTKIDGGRIIAIKENGKVTFYTRQGQLYEGLVDLEQEMLEKLPDNICLDGEITLLDSGNLTSKDQYKQTMKITRKDGEKHGVKMLVFDCMSAEEFRNQKCDMIYSERRKKLDFISTMKLTYFNVLPILYQGNDTSEITKWLNYNIDHGEEGVMINMLDSVYNFKRTNDLLKVKKMQTVDLEVIGYEGGSGNFEGMLGNLLVRYKDGNIVKVGSGFSKELREQIWKDPDSYIGKIIEVQYFEETTNQNGGISLRFPVFNDIRTDKNVADF